MNDAGLRDDITHLEDRIEALRVSIERCRKISVAAKIAIAGGLTWMLLALIALAPSTPVSFFTGLAAVLGGIVLLGSNKTTWEQTEAALQQAQLMRSQLIGNIPLRLVADEKPTLH